MEFFAVVVVIDPWGSGGPERVSTNPNKRNKQFLDYVDGLRRDGMSEVDIAKGMGISTTRLRAAKSIAKNERRQADQAMAQRLKDKGYSNVAIGKRMGVNESSVRAMLSASEKDKADILVTTANMLKDQVGEKSYIDIGTGVEHHVGVSATKLNTAVARLQEEGYKVYYVKVPQLGTGLNTTQKVLVGPDVSYSEVYANRDKIKQITNFSEDGGRTYLGLHPPLKIDPKRVGVTYKEEGGDKADGVIYVRPGVDDLSLGNARYAQVRIAVGDGHYLKGMAMYKEDLPNGVDLMFNTNKSDTGNKLDSMKKISDDPDNPFGATVRQLVKRDSDGKEQVTSAMNLVNEEGDWSNWSKSLSSQMLSKQPPSLAKAQLDMTFEKRQREFDEINALTNPTVRKKLLESFADETDSAAVHLKAAALPRQGSHVILPINSMSESQIYAPNYRDGERVVLIRYPHGGKFEIPELTVNNNHPEAKRLLGNAKDAVGIHHSVAERLSGADFDGDTVLVIPNNSGKVKTAPSLEGLKNFDPKTAYPGYPGMKVMSARTKQIEMGVVSNLITDMTIRQANNNEIAAAVRHSMVVIDAEKHGLNYRQSAIDNNIAALKEKYQDQGGARYGASTLISRATSEVRVDERKPRPAAQGGPIDKETGKKVYQNTGESYINKDGKLIIKSTKSQKLAETDDAHTLSSGTPIERIYADHSNKLKTMANNARLAAVNTPSLTYSPSAKKVYANEVETLNAKLNNALRNAPLERQAQVIANTIVKIKRDARPDMDATELKKVKAQALNEARNRMGAKKEQIVFTDREWQAIQAGAISDSKLKAMLSNADLDRVKQLATPQQKVLMTSTKTNRAQTMLNSGYTRAEVADALGVSLSTLDRALTPPTAE
jgi:predicted transcriptional regulator